MAKKKGKIKDAQTKNNEKNQQINKKDKSNNLKNNLDSALEKQSNKARKKKTKNIEAVKNDNANSIDLDNMKKNTVKSSGNSSRVSKNKGIYLETEDYLKENNLDTTFVDKKFNIDVEFVEKKKKHVLLKVIFGIFVLLLFCFSCFSIYVFINYKPEVKTKIVKEKEIVVDENIVFLGDSITDFYDLDKYFSNMHVVNSGIDGNKTYDILNNMKERVYDYNPSKVCILIGTNDITHGKSVDEIVDNIKKIIEQIKENRPYAKIYLESIYPVNDTDDSKIDHSMVNGRKNDVIKEINSKLREYSKNNDVIYIDMYSKLSDDDGNLKLDYTKEGLHLSDKGYEVVTKELKKYLKDDK